MTIPKGRFVVFDRISGIHRGVVIADFAWWVGVEDHLSGRKKPARLGQSGFRGKLSLARFIKRRQAETNGR